MRTPPRKILICGLPGSGKTTLAIALQKRIPNSVWIDGDAMRYISNNFDFSLEGRTKQAFSMRDFADTMIRQGHDVIASFVAPTHELRGIFAPDFTVWMDTIVASEYQDTNRMWQDPTHADVTYHRFGLIPQYPSAMMEDLIEAIWPPARKFDWEHPSAVMIGRFQPWHEGHRALFEAALEKYGQVTVLIRDVPLSPENPWMAATVRDTIDAALEKNFAGRFVTKIIPNTAAVVYGRDVGYGIERIELSPEVEAIRARDIRGVKCGSP